MERSKVATLPAGPAPRESQLAIQAWNLLGGMEWAGISRVADLLGIEDEEMLITQLAAIRDFRKNNHG